MRGSARECVVLRAEAVYGAGSDESARTAPVMSAIAGTAAARADRRHIPIAAVQHNRRGHARRVRLVARAAAKVKVSAARNAASGA